MGKLLVTICTSPADQQAGDLQRRRAAVEQDRVAVRNPRRRRPGDGALLLQLTGRTFFQGRQRRRIAHVNGTAVGAPDGPLLVPVVQVAADGRFRHLHRLGQVRPEPRNRAH